MSSFSSPRDFKVDPSASPRRQEREKIRRIGFFGLFGIGNFGNDGSLEAMLALVRTARPTAELLCICGKPTTVRQRFGIRSVGINWRPKNQILRRLDRLLLRIPSELATLLHAVRQIIRLDVLVVPGTGILDDFGTGPSGMPYCIFRWCLLARVLGTKVVFVSIGAGPIQHPLSRWLMKTAANMAVYRSYRDDISKNFMNCIGAKVTNDTVCPDIAFGLPAPPTLREPSAEGEPIAIGIGVMSYNGWRGDRARNDAIYGAYLSKLQLFICWLLAEGYRIRIVMGDGADQQVVESLCSSITPDHSVLRGHLIEAEPAHSLHDVMEQIADIDIMVATRYHNIVCSLKVGRPTLSIGYAEKNDVLLQKMGLGDFCQHIEQLDVELLIQQFQKLAANRKWYEKRIRKNNHQFREMIENQNSLLLERFL